MSQCEFPFELPPSDPKSAEKTFRQLSHPIWTECKAKLIERYLYYFVQITHHGTYIDCFAGPQQEDKHDMWSAKLVIESKPRWLRKFFLFEIDPSKVEMIEQMVNLQPVRTKKEPKRKFKIYEGDSNEHIKLMLKAFPIKDAEACFALLDQRTFECLWETVITLATHKKGGNKIELFYFFPQGWLDRSVAALADVEEKMLAWWGAETWREMMKKEKDGRAEMLCERFKRELGYKHVYPYRIFSTEEGGRIMYYMIHASDHNDAAPLMWRAYKNALRVDIKAEQLDLMKGAEAEG